MHVPLLMPSPYSCIDRLAAGMRSKPVHACHIWATMCWAASHEALMRIAHMYSSLLRHSPHHVLLQAQTMIPYLSLSELQPIWSWHNRKQPAPVCIHPLQKSVLVAALQELGPSKHYPEEVGCLPKRLKSNHGVAALLHELLDGRSNLWHVAQKV